MAFSCHVLFSPNSVEPFYDRGRGLRIMTCDDRSNREGRSPMPVQFARPDIADLVLCAYERRLHPELFESRATAHLQCGGLTLTMRLCSAGHWLELVFRGHSLTEAMSERQIPLPNVKRICEHRIKGGRTQSFVLSSGAKYTSSCQLERLEPAVFIQAHEELLADCRRADLSMAFPGGNRWSPGPVSLIQAHLERDNALIHAFHTFPESCAVVKTQTLLESTTGAW